MVKVQIKTSTDTCCYRNRHLVSTDSLLGGANDSKGNTATCISVVHSYNKRNCQRQLHSPTKSQMISLSTKSK